jgi:E3 ubiquitin-protein ligase UBR4
MLINNYIYFFIGMYVVSTKPAGFSIEITNQDSSLVMTGVRIMLGTQDSQRAPSYVEVHELILFFYDKWNEL